MDNSILDSCLIYNPHIEYKSDQAGTIFAIRSYTIKGGMVVGSLKNFVLAVSGLVIMVLFQNCSSGFHSIDSASQNIQSLTCSSGGQCQELIFNDTPKEVAPPLASNNSQTSPIGNGSGTLPKEPVSNPTENLIPQETISKLVNVVHGGGKEKCEKLIGEAYGKKISCSLGGGCGISCGKPGVNCASANPSSYGACISEKDLLFASTYVPASTVPEVIQYNFVAGSKDVCEQSIKERLGITQSCHVGGGCGVSCGAPNGGCPSANPSLWGACVRK